MTINRMIQKLQERWNIINIIVEKDLVTVEFSDTLMGPYKQIVGTTIHRCLEYAIEKGVI